MGCQESGANSLRLHEKSTKLGSMAIQPAEPRVEKLARSPIQAAIAGNRLTLIETGEERLRVLLDLIGGAERSVRLLMYMFNRDAVGEAVRDSLAEAAARGVEVRLLIDGFGSAAPADFFARIAAAGAEHCVFNPSYGR